jgi:hypothetical protein
MLVTLIATLGAAMAALPAPTFLWVGLALGFAAPVFSIALAMHRLGVTQRRMLAHAHDRALGARQRDTGAALNTLADVESLAAQLVADAYARPVSLRMGALVTHTDPAPYFSVTDIAGTRYFFTTAPVLFRTLHIVHQRDPVRNISCRSASARADALAIWEALMRIKQLTHTAVPRGADWHVIAYSPVRARGIRPGWLRRPAPRSPAQAVPAPVPAPGLPQLEAGR